MKSFAAIAAAAVLMSMAVPAYAGLPRERTYRPHGTPVGTIIQVHGGRWKQSSNAIIDTAKVTSLAFASWGWKTVVPSFRGGKLALGDLQAVLNREIRLAKGKPVCVSGESSGGHLALLLAADKRVTCAIAQAAPVDLTPAHPSKGDDLGTVLSARKIWGKNAAAMSPIRFAARTQAAVLVLSGAKDSAAPAARADHYVALAPHAANITMRSGSGKQVEWEHAKVNRSSLVCASVKFHRLLNAAAHGRTAAYRALGARKQVCS